MTRALSQSFDTIAGTVKTIGKEATPPTTRHATR